MRPRDLIPSGADEESEDSKIRPPARVIVDGAVTVRHDSHEENLIVTAIGLGSRVEVVELEGEAVASESRVVLLTGASAGLGRACADRLGGTGWTVIGASRRGTVAGASDGLVMDVDDDSSVQEGVTAVIERYGRIDALVAAAGWGLAGAVEQTSLEEAKAQFETNFWGAVRVVQQVLPIMRTRGHGRIVLMSSIGGIIGIPFQAFYCASKFALEGLGESLAYEVAPFGITVTLVEPGNFATDFTSSRRMARSSGDDASYRGALEKAISVMERDEVNGAAPEAVASIVSKVLDVGRPPRRVSVGKFDERIGLLAKRFMPFRAFEAAAKSSLGVD